MLKVIILILTYLLVNIRISSGVEKIIMLPEPQRISNFSLEEALQKRRSRRNYSGEPISLEQLSQLLWSAYGITKEPFYKTVPSAGACYPMTIYVSVVKVKGLKSGFYQYIPKEHQLELISTDNFTDQIYTCGYNQGCLRNQAITILMSADFDKITTRYGKRAYRYTYMEAGHISQNIYLQTESLDLATVAVGAYDEETLNKILPIPNKEDIIYLMPVGKKRTIK